MKRSIKTSNTVTIVDSIMGSGKTSWAIQLMNETPEIQKFIYVTPYRSEIERIKQNVVNREFVTPDSKYGKGRKYEHFKKLIGEERDIVVTHSLFSYADKELLELFKQNNYILIMDEVFEVVEQISLKKKDLNLLMDYGAIELEQDMRVRCIEEKINDTRYEDVKEISKWGNLFVVDNDALILLFPIEIFKAFESVYILTYYFEGQLQRYYFDYYSIEYVFKSVNKGNEGYKLINCNKDMKNRQYFKSLITILEHEKLNSIGNDYYALSKEWFSKQHNKPKIEQLRKHLINYVQHITKAKSNVIMWTTFKDYKQKIKGKGYSSEEKNDKPGCFTPFNLRATNKYRHKTVLAFCINRFLNPKIKKFFKQNDITVNEELLALSDLLQWIYRSAIRDGKPIEIYIPSRRMRTLLIQWLNNEI